jgi:hypothetical protein
MNAFLIGVGYDKDDSEVGHFIAIGKMPYWAAFFKDLNIRLALRWEKWYDGYADRVDDFLTSKFKELKRFDLEGNEYLTLIRTVSPGQFHTWMVFPDWDEDEVEFVLALQVISWDTMMFKSIDGVLARLKFGPYLNRVSWPAQAWISTQVETMVELAVTGEEFTFLDPDQSLT